MWTPRPFINPDFNDRIIKPTPNTMPIKDSKIIIKEQAFPNQIPIEATKEDTGFIWPKTQPMPAVEIIKIDNTKYDDCNMFGKICVCGHSYFSHTDKHGCYSAGCSYGKNERPCEKFIIKNEIHKTTVCICGHIKAEHSSVGYSACMNGDCWPPKSPYLCDKYTPAPDKTILPIIKKDEAAELEPQFCNNKCKERYSDDKICNIDYPYKIISGVILTRREASDKMNLCSYCLEPLNSRV